MAKEKTPTSLSKRWIAVLRFTWIVLVALALALTIFGWTLKYQEVAGTCSGEFCAQADALSADPIGIGGVLGLPAKTGLVLNIVIEIVSFSPYLIVGLLLFSRRSADRLVWLGAFALPLFGFATMLTPVDAMSEFRSWLGLAARVILAIGQITFLVFFYVFPDGRFRPRWTGLVALYWIVAFLAYIPLASFGYDPFATELGSILFILTIVGMIATQVYRYRKFSNTIEKQQTKWVVIGLSISLGGFVFIVLLGELLYGETYPPLYEGVSSLAITLLFALIPVWIGVAILRYRLWDVEVIINRALIYGPLSAILAGIFAASIVILNSLARELFGAEATTTAGVVSALVVASVFQPLRSRIEKWINTRLYPDNINLNKEFIEFNPEFRASIRLKDLLRIVVQKMVGLVNVKHASILLADSRGGFRRVTGGQSPTILKPGKTLQTELQKGKVVSKGNQQGLWVPLYVRRMRAHDVIGLLDIGPRKDKSGFSSDDKKALSNLGAEIGASIYAAQLREKRN